MKFVDIETDEVLTVEELRKEYEELKANECTEAEDFNMYIQSCLKGTLEYFKES